MRAMILAAGRGERLRPLTNTIPKPLLDVGGKLLIEHHLEGLAVAGFREVVINISHLGDQIRDTLGNGPFAIINGDVFTSYPLSRLRAIKCGHAHLVLVPNPAHNSAGDFELRGGYVNAVGEIRHTFSGISVYHPRFFESAPAGNFSVVPMLQAAMTQQQVTGEFFKGIWHDIGTLERLEALRSQLI